MFYASDNRIWGSVSQLPDDFTTGTADDDSFIYETAAEQIRWLKAGRRMMVGDYAQEWQFYSGSEDLPLTPTRAKIRSDSICGSNYVQGLKVGNVIMFVQKAGRKIRQLAYQFMTDVFNADEISILAEHITESGIKEWDYQGEADSIVWMTRNDGTRVGFTYDQSQEVMAWHRHITGSDTSDTYESLAIVPYNGSSLTWDVARDVVWFITKRTIGGATKRYVEYTMPEVDSDVRNAFYVDCGLMLNSAMSVTSVSGLSHLQGRRVSILVDGSPQADATVTSSSVSISPAGFMVKVGLPFTSTLEILRPEGGSQDGTSQGKRKRIHDIMVRFYRTVGANVGSSSDSMDIVPFRTPADPMDTAVPMFSGDKVFPFEGGWDDNGYVRITQTQPLPMTVLAVAPRIEVND